MIINLKKMLLNNIQLKNFKCFRETNIDFGKITLLIGANSSGKSSLIYPLLAVLQTEKFPFYLSPNGSYINMGGFYDVSFQNKNNFIEIILSFKEISYKYKDVVRSLGKSLIHTNWNKDDKNNLPKISYLRVKTDFIDTYYDETEAVKDGFVDEETGIQFRNISERKQLHNFTSETFAFVNEIKKRTNFIHSFREAPERFYFREAKSKDKIDSTGKGYENQIIEWEEANSEKFKNLVSAMKELKLISNIISEKGESGTFQLKVKIHKNSIAVPLTDVGFGVSKLLPIIVADLQLGNNSLLAISEPEIDLHPSVQADFANYLVKQANENQKQYLIETHSEYLLNRIRLLIAKGEIKEEDVKVYYFENNGIETITHNVKFQEDGQIVGAPKGFFETYETDIFEIAIKS